MLAARALDLRLCTADQLVTALASRRRQTDRRVLLEMLSDVADGSNSAAELRYLRDVKRAHRLPTSRRQAPTGDGRRRDVEYEEFGWSSRSTGGSDIRRGPSGSVTADAIAAQPSPVG